MKNWITKIAVLAVAYVSILVPVWAQVPLGINYQAIARDASGQALDHQSIHIKIAMLDSAVGGTSLYEETHERTTDAFGLFTLVIGQGNPLTGSFDAINWGSGAKFLQVAIDPEGGNNFIDMGTTQLLAVPYALYAAKSGGTPAPFTFHPGKGIAISNDSLTNTGDTDASDDLTVTTEAKGDVSGNFSALKIEQLQGATLEIPSSIDTGSVLKWDGMRWKPGADSTVWNNRDSLISYQKGRVGIGTAEPEAQLHIDRLVARDDTFIQPLLKLTTTDTTITGMGGPASTGLSLGLSGNQSFINSNQRGTFRIGSVAKEQSSLALITAGETRLSIDAEGNVGIGIQTPNHLHHVHDQKTNSNHNFESFTLYTNGLTGIDRDNDGLLVGTINSLAMIENREAWNFVISTGFSGVGDLMFGSGGKWPRVTIDAEGNVGIGRRKPDTKLHVDGNITAGKLKESSSNSHELRLVHASTGGGGATAGLKIENVGISDNWWALYTTNSSGDLELYYKGSLRGEFDPDDGEYKKRSDGRLKRFITPLSPALEKVLRLQPSTYYFKDDKNPAHPSLGFIAQEVQALFPELVGYAGEEQDIMTLNYDGFGVLAIKAIQEQQALLEQLLQRIEALEQQLTLEK